MIENNEKGKEGLNEEKREIFKTWADSYTAVSKMWEDSYLKLYKPWLELTEDMFERTDVLSKEATPQKYKDFYDEWLKKYQNTFGKFYPVPELKPNKEVLEKFLSSAEKSNKIYTAWIGELEENSKRTQEILKGEPNPAKNKECYDMWMKTNEKIFDELLTLPTLESAKDIFEKYTGIPDIYLGSFVQMAKLWKNTYSNLYGPWIASMQKLSEKMADLSRGDASPEAYKEFYDIWLETYEATYGKYVQSMRPTKEVFENFSQSATIYLTMYKSWIAALEKMVEKTKEISRQTTDPELSREFYNVWVKMYEKAFDSFFEDMPLAGPMKDMMEPVKILAKLYADMFAQMSRTWVK
jgi:hypothetical protein